MKQTLALLLLALAMNVHAQSDTVYIVKHDTVYVEKAPEAACCQQAATPATNANVPYTVARNYFVRNDTPFRGNKLISTAEDFEAIFGTAATMGQGGEPTPIDFNRQCVLAIVRPETDVRTEITPNKLSVDENQMTFSYNILQGRTTTYTTTPMLILIIDKAYERLNVNVSSRVKHLTIDDDPDAVLQGVYD